jgi:hypothetical protein
MRPIADVLIDRAREEQTLRHLDDLVSYLGQIREGRTSVILFTEGWRLFNDGGGLMSVTGRQRPPQCDQHLIRYANLGLQSRFREIMSRANRANVTFYPVNPAGLATFDLPISSRMRGTGNLQDSALRQNGQNINDRMSAMQTLASNTDGIAVVNTNDIKAGLLRVSDQLKAYYLLGYYSTNRKFDGKARRITVEVKQPGIDVKARRGYTAPTEEERAARAAASSAPAGPVGPSPLEVALDALARIRPSAELFVHAALGAGPAGQLTVVTEISGPQLARGVLDKGGTLEVTVTGAGGVAIGSTQAALPAAARAGVVVLDVPQGTDATAVGLLQQFLHTTRLRERQFAVLARRGHEFDFAIDERLHSAHVDGGKRVVAEPDELLAFRQAAFKLLAVDDDALALVGHVYTEPVHAAGNTCLHLHGLGADVGSDEFVRDI